MKRGVLGLFIVLTALVAVSPSVEAIAGCGNVAASDTLTANVTTTASCIVITGNNVIFNCQGNQINFTGTPSSQVGINATTRNNVTLINCRLNNWPMALLVQNIPRLNLSNINISNSTTGFFGGAINNSVFNNIRYSGSGGSDPLSMQLMINSTFSNIWANHSSNMRFFISNSENVTASNFELINLSIVSSGNNSRFENINVNIQAPSPSFQGISASGINLTLNNINTTSTANVGLSLNSCTHCTASNLVSSITGSGTAATLVVSCTNCTVTNVTSTNTNTGANSNAMFLSGATNSTFQNAFLYGNATPLRVSSSPNLRINNVTVVSTGEWILTQTTHNLTVSNITFNGSSASLRFPTAISWRNVSVNQSVVNVTSSRIFVNSTSLTFLNTSAQLTQTSANSSAILVDENDDGQFSVCNPPQCIRQSFSSGTLIFNVSSFTTYGPASFGGVNITLSKGDSPDPINVSSTTLLSYQINFTVNDGTAFNITINETYPSGVTFINATPSPTTGNTSWNAGNLTSGETYQINITVNVSNSLSSGTVLTNIVNVTYENSTGSQFLINVTENTTVSVPLSPPILENVTLAATSIQNLTSDNLTVAFNLTSPSNMNPAWNITDWRVNQSSIVFFQYPFENNVSNITTSLTDYSTSNISATLGNGASGAAPTWTTSGQVGAAYDFDGTDDQINISDTTDPTEFSLEVWVKPDVVSSKNIFLRTDASGPGTSWSHQLRITAGSAFEAYVFDGALKTVTGNSTVAAGSWYHVVITAEDGGNLALYVNGGQEGTNASVTTLWTGGTNYRVGSNSGGGFGFFDGIIDEVRLYNRTLTPSEINLLYSEGLAGRQPTTLHSSETEVGETWSVAVTPNNHDYEGNTTLTNNVTIIPAAATCPGIITTDTNLTENITVATSGACVSFGADNIVLDCQGYTMTGNGSGTGINATSRTNVEIRNCNVATFNRNILFSGTSNSRLLSSNTTNSTDINIFFSTSGSNNNLSNLVVNHNATTADAIQFFVAGTNQLRNISIFLRGTGGSGAGVYFFGSSDNSLDNLTSYAEAAAHDHVQITSTALGNNVSNIVTYNGSMLSASTSSDSIRFNNAIGTNSVINIATANNIINNVTLTGSSTSQMLTTGGSSSNYSNINISNTGGTGIIASGSTNRLINITTVGTIGMTLSGSTNVLENIQSNATGIGQNSILISGSNNNVRNVTSQAGSGIGIGVSIASGNNISGFTVNEGYLAPISIQSGATNTIFTNGTINSNPTCSNCDGIALSALTNAILDNITIVSPTSSLFDWISTAASTSNASISNITFQTSSGSIKTIQNVTLPVSLNLNRNHLNISSNRSFLNSTNASFLNSTAQITLHGVNTSAIAVDFDDDGTYEQCNATQCQLESFNGSTIVFNVSSFTSYSAMNLSVASAFPETISNDTTLDQNYTVNGSAFIINASNIVFDCNGTTITGNGSGEGINVSGQTNVTIQNCNIINFNQNIFFSGTTNSRLNNNNVTNSTIESIFLTSSSNSNNITNSIISGNSSTQESLGLFSSGSNIIENSNISGITRTAILLALSTNNIIRNINAQSISSTGIDIQSTSTGTNLTNVSIFNGTTGISVGSSNTRVADMTIIGASVTGFSVSASTNGHVINNVSVNGTSSFGFLLGGNSYSIENIVSNATTGVQFGNGDSINLSNVVSTGTTSQGVLITSGSDNNRLNNITSRSSSGAGLSVSTSNNNIITNYSSSSSTSNAVTVSGTGNVFSDGVANSNAAPAIVASTSGHSFNNTIINTNDDWFVTSSIATSTNITNTTFNDTDGSINHFANITLSNTTTISQAKLNITPNKAFLNSTNLSSLNTSAQITLNSVTSSVLLVDFEDDGTYQLCNATQCVLQSFNGSTAIFNVTSFTSYSTSSSGDADVTISKSDSPDPINLSNTTILNYQFTATVTNGTAYNLNITETYPGEVTFINATPSPDSGNNFWFAGNLTTGQNFNISIYVNVSTSTPNGTSIVNTIDTMFENSTGGMYNLSVSEATLVINEIEGQTNATLTKTDSPDPLNISNTTLLTYQVNFTVNNGTAYNATIIETYSGNVTFVNATPTPASGNNNWSVGNLTAPSVYQINITVNVSDSLANGSIVTNTVNATYENATGSSFNIDATAVTTILVDAAPANATIVTLTKTDSPDPLNISDTTLLTYQINFTVTNGTAINTTINETYPSNTTFVNATPTPTTGNTSWSAGNISAGTTYQINITLNVSSELSNGTTLTNTVNTTYFNATGSALNTNVQENTTVTRNLEFNATVITMTKTDAPDPVVAGQDLTYTININVTNGTAYNITLTDTYPSQVSFVSATPAANATNNTWIVGNLTIGESFQVNITVNVASGTANGTTINNSANISYANETGSILTLNATTQTLVSTQSFPIVINNNTNITTNGTTTGPGIVINSSNVTVSCNGNTITGSGSSVGVNITGFNNVTIQDCVFVNFATGAYIENSNINQFTRNTFRSVTNGVNLLGTSQTSAFNHTTIAASGDWVFTSAASSGNVFQNTSYNDTGGQIIITPSVTFAANTNASQSRLDITSPDAFLNSTALPFLDAVSRVTITGITNTATALILGDFDDDGTYEICSAPTCTLISFASGTAVFDTAGWSSYTVVDGGVNFTLSKTSSPDPVTPGNNVVFTITATVNSGFAQNITVVESPPAELTFVTSTPTNVSDNTWLLNNLSAGQSAQINVTYAVNSSFTGTIENNVSVTFQNSTNGTISTNVSENTTAQTPAPSGGSGGGGGGGSSASICPPFCQYPENKDLPVCRNNCPPAQAPIQSDFGSMFPPVSDVIPPTIEEPVEEPVVEEVVVEETPVEEPKPVKSKFFPWWYVLIAIIAIVFMIWETHHIVSKIHKPSKEQSKLDKIDKDIIRMRKMLKKK